MWWKPTYKSHSYVIVNDRFCIPAVGGKNLNGGSGHEPEVESFKFAVELLPLSSDTG